MPDRQRIGAAPGAGLPPAQTKRIVVLIIAFLGTAVCHGSDPSKDVPLFPNPVFDLGGNAPSIATADFNRDRQPDLVVASNSYRGAIAVLLGKRDGTFRDPISIVIGGEVRWVLAQDLNRDRNPDILVTSDYQVQVYAGRGDGTFLQPVTFVSGESPFGPPAIGDFNGDRRPDIVVPDFKSNLVRVFLARKGSSYSATQVLITVESPESVTSGDFDGDEAEDIAVFDRNSCDLSLHPGRGDGTFGPERRIQSGVYLQTCVYNWHFLASGDFNHDHHDDLAISSQSDGQLIVLLADGQGHFKTPTKYALRGNLSPLWVGDVDRNRTTDLAVADYSQDDAAILLAQRNGTFSAPLRVPVGRGPTSVLFADLNLDGVNDLVAAFRTYSGSVHAFLGNANGTWGPPIYAVPGNGLSDLTLGDFNDDRQLDVAAPVSLSREVYLLLGHGDGTFGTAVRHEVGWNPVALVGGDFDNDGRLDLAVASRDFNPRRDGVLEGGIWPSPKPLAAPHGFVTVLRQSADHALQAGDPLPVGWDPAQLRTGDLNGDGNLDLLALNRGEPELDEPAGVSLLLGKGDGTFATELRLDIQPNPREMVLGDFDSDGHPDLALLEGGREPALSLHKGLGDGRFEPGRVIKSDDFITSLNVGDLDSDGHTDLVLGVDADPHTGQGTSSIVVLLGKGDGTFSPLRAATGVSGRPVMADFDGDGHADLAVLGESGEVSILIAKSNTSFLPTSRFAPLGRATFLAVGDLTGDKRPDLVTDVPGGISALLNRNLQRKAAVAR